MIPKNYDQPSRPPANPPGSGQGWSERPLVNPNNPQHPTPGVDLLDRLMARDDQRERQQTQQQQVTTPDATMMLEMGTMVMQFLAKQNEMLTQQVADLQSALADKEQAEKTAAQRPGRPKASLKASTEGKQP
jgi:hypothetical protein